MVQSMDVKNVFLTFILRSYHVVMSLDGFLIFPTFFKMKTLHKQDINVNKLQREHIETIAINSLTFVLLTLTEIILF